MVTDRNLVVYSKEWETPAEVTPLKDIVALDVDYDESFFEDSMVVVETIEGMEVTFPLSSEKGLDKKFVEAIRAKMPKVEPQEVEETSPPNELKAAS